ncbi:hypothetical protein F5Y11DRAFT_347907 [Daldinia sp. FL1419]|nr:hypothetical protein F5Y11DRAFT_347907 [Daldinia sp. FL1419]
MKPLANKSRPFVQILVAGERAATLRTERPISLLSHLQDQDCALYCIVLSYMCIISHIRYMIHGVPCKPEKPRRRPQKPSLDKLLSRERGSIDPQKVSVDERVTPLLPSDGCPPRSSGSWDGIRKWQAREMPLSDSLLV